MATHSSAPTSGCARAPSATAAARPHRPRANSVVATGATFHLTYREIAAEGATNTATVGYLLPVVSVALGVIVLDEAFGLRIAIGMVVVLVGVGLTRLHSRAPAPTDVIRRLPRQEQDVRQ
ncbi:EamA family transporter [Micromonospora sp. NPDC047527]|uniref:EamA family transporter n=1 Tax=unclassified Micromonospora TaxID=2617518 RepID=UPI0033F93A41